jgi:hypothetical protein
MQQDFHIGPGPEAMTLLDQHFSQLEIVEDFSVAHQHYRTVFVEERLVAALQVDNAQTAKAESQMIFRSPRVSMKPTRPHISLSVALLAQWPMVVAAASYLHDIALNQKVVLSLR